MNIDLFKTGCSQRACMDVTSTQARFYINKSKKRKDVRMMAVELEGLEFQIEAKSDEATKGVDALSSTFSKLKNTDKGRSGT